MNRLYLLALVLTSLVFASPLVAKPKKVVTIVVIEGVSYKVRARGDEALVTRQAIAFNANTSHFVKAKRAAELATDCKAVEVFPVFDVVNVKLNCTVKPEANAENAIIKRNE